MSIIMIKIIIIIILIILILIIFNTSYENMSMYKCYDSNTNKTKLIEITSLPRCNKKIKLNNTININTLNNNNYAIYQDIIDPLLHTIDIDNSNYNLTNVEWRKSKLLWNNKPVGLELHLTYYNFISINSCNVIIPLDLVNNTTQVDNTFQTVDNTTQVDNTFQTVYNTTQVDNTFQTINNDTQVDNTFQTEGFINTYYKPMDTTIKPVEDIMAQVSDSTMLDSIKKIIPDETNIFNLNLNYNRPYDINNISLNNLLNSNDKIPEYECCGITIGNIKKLDLCIISTIVNYMTKLYSLKDINCNDILVTEPVPFNETIGLLIRNNIIDDPNIIYL